jgi:hypothetical protein
MNYAGFWLPALAILVDLTVWVPVLVLYFTVRGLSIPVAIVALLIITVLSFAYPVYFLSRWARRLER